jgi:NADH-quinone oxidoreductase subunit L
VFWFLGMLAALMTAFYMFRLLFVTFHGEFRGSEKQKHHLHESPALMTIPLVVLALLSAFGGMIGLPKLMGAKHLLEEFLEPVLEKSMAAKVNIHELSHNAELGLMAVAVAIGVLGILMSWFYFKKYNPNKVVSGLLKMADDKWYFDEAYEKVISKPLLQGSAFKERIFEKGFLDAIVNGVGRMVQIGSEKMRLLQNGMVGFYMFMMVLGIILLFALQILLK